MAASKRGSARTTAGHGDTPHKLYTTGPGDMGYLSTAQLPDGKLVTVFYAAQSPLHAAYHMGVIGWTAPPALPQVERVDAQPLLLLTKRLVEALDTNGDTKVLIAFPNRLVGRNSGWASSSALRLSHLRSLVNTPACDSWVPGNCLPDIRRRFCSR